MYWTFLDFVDDNDVNQIKTWIDGLPPSERTQAADRFRMLLLNLRAQRVLNDPYYTKLLHGAGDGLMELRFKVRHVPYRPLAYYGPRQGEVTLLLGAIEHNGRFVPGDACQIAQRRRALVQSDRRYSTPHDFAA